MYKSSIENKGNDAKPMLGDVVNYSDCITELNQFGLAQEFESLMNNYHSSGLIEMIKGKEFICENSTASIVRSVLSKIEINSELYNKWIFIFPYFLKLPFERNKELLINFLGNKQWAAN